MNPRPASLASRESIPENGKPFQRRLMEVFAGLTEHADYPAGRLIGQIEQMGELDNTLIFYIWGDNGSSSEGLYSTISEQLAQNGIPTTMQQHLTGQGSLAGLTRRVAAKPTTCARGGPGVHSRRDPILRPLFRDKPSPRIRYCHQPTEPISVGVETRETDKRITPQTWSML